MALFLADVGWPDVEEYLRHDERLIVVLGSTEQHGRHLVFGTDVIEPWEIARRVSDRTGVLVAPPLCYGMSLHHLVFPGSLSLRPHTLSLVVADLLHSAYQHGFSRILILNGHGGNVPAIQVALAEVLNELHGLHVRLESWWTSAEVKAVFETAFGTPGGHADAGETSVVLAARPEVVRLDRAAYNPDAPAHDFLTGDVFLEHYPNGVIGGDPRQGSAEVGEQAIEAAVTRCVRWLEA